MQQNLEIICIKTDAYYQLLEDLIQRFKLTQKPTEEKWISGPEAMKLLRIKSKATLQKMRDEGNIRFSQPEKKIILYDVQSIHDYLEDFVYEPFGLDANKKRNVKR